jgi:hypothetical protein
VASMRRKFTASTIERQSPFAKPEIGRHSGNTGL